LSVIFSERRLPPRIKSGAGFFRDHAPLACRTCQKRTTRRGGRREPPVIGGGCVKSECRHSVCGRAQHDHRLHGRPAQVRGLAQDQHRIEAVAIHQAINNFDLDFGERRKRHHRLLEFAFAAESKQR
jgi:hypothetical protein